MYNGSTYYDYSDNAFTIDSTPPAIGSFTIVGTGPSPYTYTYSIYPTLNIPATDANGMANAKMQIYNDVDTLPTIWFDFSTQYNNWMIYNAEGTRTVHIRLKDQAGNISGWSADTIILDSSAPSGGATITGTMIGTQKFITNPAATVTLSYTDGQSGMNSVQFSQDGPSSGWGDWLPYAPAVKTYPFASGDGPKSLYVHARNGAYNTMKIMGYADTVVLDTLPPVVTFDMKQFYSISTWNLPVDPSIKGMVQDPGAGFASNGVTVKIKKGPLYWNGSSFAAAVTSFTAGLLPSAGGNNAAWSYVLAPVTALTDNATYEVIVTATDKLGHVSAPVSWVFTYDMYAPVANITSPASGYVANNANTNITILGVANDDTPGTPNVSYTLSYAPKTDPTNKIVFKTATVTKNASAVTLGNLDVSSSAFTDGRYIIELRVSSPAGNVSTSVIEVVVDKNAPVTALTLPAVNGDNGYYTTTVTATLTATDAGSGIKATYYQLDGGTVTTYSTPKVINTEGIHTLKYWSVDNANQIETTKEATIKIDLANPQPPSILVPAQNPYTTNQGTLTFSGQCPPDTDRLYFNGVQITFTPGTGSNWGTWSYPATLASGSNTYTVIVKDISGRQSQASTVVDSTLVAPAAPTINPIATPTNQPQPAISGTYVIGTGDTQVNAIFIQIIHNGTPIFAQPQTVTLAPPTGWNYNANLNAGDGTYIIRVTAKNNAGNYSPVTETSLVLDTVAPAIPTVNSVVSPTNITTQEISGNASADTALVLIDKYLNGAYKQTYTVTPLTNRTFSSTVYMLDGDGTYTFKIRARDAAGNVSSPDVIRTIVCDTTPPVSSIMINGGATLTNLVTASLALNSYQETAIPVVSMSFSDDNVTYSDPEPYSTAKTWQLPSGDGQKTVYARFTDQVGNISAPVSASITLDQTPPSINDVVLNGNSLFAVNPNPAIDRKVTKPTPSIDISVADSYTDFTADASGIVVEFVRKDTIERTLTGSLNLSVADSDPLPADEYTLRIMVTDLAGNATVQEINGIRVTGGDPQITSTVIASPNPFNPLTGNPIKIWFTVSADPTAVVGVYLHDITGKLIWKRTYPASQLLIDKKVEWNGYNDYDEIAGNGVYLVRIVDETNKKLIGKTKIIVIKSK